MNKIVLLPLDERPCNYIYPGLMPFDNCNLVLPPKEIMGNKKIPGDISKINAWLFDSCKDANIAIISLDTLIFGGIVPSRLNNDSYESLINRCNILKEIKKVNPTIKLFCFELIMRCPSYNSDDEEPKYYQYLGEDIFKYGEFTHKKMLNILTDDEKEEFNSIKKRLDKEALNDYLDRRHRNTDVLISNLNLLKDGTIDFFIVPQDDASPYGFTALDQIKVRKFLKDNYLHMKSAMYPSADDIGLILLSRAVSYLNNKKLKFYVKYASSKAKDVIPWFEDRALDETIKYHIISTNGIRVDSLEEADIVLMVNMGSKMVHDNDPSYSLHYDIERNLADFINYIKYAKEKGKLVAICDVSKANGADVEFTKLLENEDLLLKVDAYAGWNTSSNTIGTSVCEASCFYFSKNETKNRSFLLLRYYEDIGYMAYVRQYVTNNLLKDMGYDYFKVDGVDGKVAKLVKDNLIIYMNKNYPSVAKYVKDIVVRQPWNRMFETEIEIKEN